MSGQHEKTGYYPVYSPPSYSSHPSTNVPSLPVYGSVPFPKPERYDSRENVARTAYVNSPIGQIKQPSFHQLNASSMPARAPFYEPQKTQNWGNITDDQTRNPRKYNDLWASLLFVTHLAAFVIAVVAVYVNGQDDSSNSPPVSPMPGVVNGTEPLNNNQAYNNISYNDNSTNITEPVPMQSSDSSAFEVDASWFPAMIVLTVLTSIVVSIAYFYALRRYTGTMVTLSFWLNILITAALGGLFLAFGAFIPACVAFLMSAISFWIWRTWKDRIPFGQILLETAMDITRKYPSVFFVGSVGTVLILGYSFVFYVAMNGGLSYLVDPGLRLYLVFISFNLYWTVQVIKNVVHTTVAGTAATFYFYGQVTADGSVSVSTSNPTLGSLRRAMTTSFGSICYGSLVIAVIKIIRSLLTGNRNSTQGSSVFNCIGEWIDSIVQYFNVYAFTQVAIYGKDYCKAAKDTWALIKKRGIDVIINDCVIDRVLGFGSFTVGLIAGGVAFAMTYQRTFYCNDDTRQECDVWVLSISILIGLCGLVFGYIVFGVIAEVIQSAVSTTFVCLAESPETLQRVKPEFYRKVIQAYPAVVTVNRV